MKKERILVTGGAGYVGSKLVPALLKNGYAVTVLDLYLYGDEVLAECRGNPDLIEVKGDIRDLGKVYEALRDSQHVIHLACISNDPSFELNPTLGKSINLDAFEPLLKASKEKGVRRFIYASSSSVYGVKSEPNVTEEMSLEPLTDYSKYKAECEEILFKTMSPEFICTAVRPATVCGYAPRQRLDVVVNILTNLAYHTGRIKVMGGSQMRPNIHIDDMVDAYIALLKAPEKKIQGEIFNVGTQNHTVLELGQMVSKVVGKADLEVVPTNDHRSYHVSSEKIGKVIGFVPRRTIQQAVESLIEAFESGKLPNSLEDERYFNIKKMKGADLR